MLANKIKGWHCARSLLHLCVSKVALTSETGMAEYCPLSCPF